MLVFFKEGLIHLQKMSEFCNVENLNPLNIHLIRTMQLEAGSSYINNDFLNKIDPSKATSLKNSKKEDFVLFWFVCDNSFDHFYEALENNFEEYITVDEKECKKLNEFIKKIFNNYNL
jgi:hypothetical protein